MSDEIVGASSDPLNRVRVTDARDYKDASGLFAKKILTTTSEIEIYRNFITAEFSELNFNIANSSVNDTVFITLWASQNKLPSLVDLIEPTIKLEPGAVYTRTFFRLGTNEAIFAKSTIANIVVIRIDGSDYRPKR